MPTSLLLAILVTVTAFAAALCGLIAAGALSDWHRKGQGDNALPADPTVFLFDDHELIDSSPAARALIRALPPGPSDWNRLTAFLATRFPGLVGMSEHVTGPCGTEFMAPDGSRAEISGGAGLPVRITLSWNDEGSADVRIDRFCLRAQEEEIARLRQMSETLRMPVWMTDRTGIVIWANAAYLQVLAATAARSVEDLTWPLENLGERLRAAGDPQRLELPGHQGTAARWFILETAELEDGQLHVATPADALVRAERSRDELMQTLAKTFAELPFGLAVFDRQRRLVLFNPALTDLTGVGPDFLLGQPTLFAFFDRLREGRMIPEPRDYHGWRQAIGDIEKAATGGGYDQTWNLPSGVTYRVSARPHPDGALALWFEDVSADVTMARRFRSEMQTCLEVVEEMGIAVAVFSPSGRLTLSNSAFAGLWGGPAEARLAAVDITEMSARWQDMSAPTTAWADLVHFVRDPGHPAPWHGAARLLSGQSVNLRAARLGSGATMVEFRGQECLSVQGDAEPVMPAMITA